MRLTAKQQDDISYGYSDEMAENIDREQMLLNNYGELEDIEDKLGIKLITLFKALKNETRIYYKEGKIIKCGVINHFLNVPNAWYITICGNDKFYSTRKYGKTWALTKEELL